MILCGLIKFHKGGLWTVHSGFNKAQSYVYYQYQILEWNWCVSKQIHVDICVLVYTQICDWNKGLSYNLTCDITFKLVT